MATSPTPVVFIHGLWLHSTSWQPWVELFRDHGYDPIAPEWPGIPGTVAEARAHPEKIPGHGVKKVADHFAGIIQSLPARPVVIGHSFGGLLAQNLLGRDLAAAAVAIDPAPIKGVLALPVSSLRVASVALRNPANLKRAVGLTEKEWRYGFTNTLPEEESQELYDKWMIPTPGRPLFEAALANFTFSADAPTKVNVANADRGPLLVTSGGEDHTVPPAVCRGTVRQYRGSKAVTELREFPGKGHSLILDHGWREVADATLAWLTERLKSP